MSRHCQVRDCLRPVDMTLQVSMRRRLEEQGPLGLPVTGYAELNVLACSSCGGQILDMFGGPAMADVSIQTLRGTILQLPGGDSA